MSWRLKNSNGMDFSNHIYISEYIFICIYKTEEINHSKKVSESDVTFTYFSIKTRTWKKVCSQLCIITFHDTTQKFKLGGSYFG